MRKHVDPRCAGQPRRMLLFLSAGTPHAEIVIIARTVHGVMSVKYTGRFTILSSLKQGREKQRKIPRMPATLKRHTKRLVYFYTCVMADYLLNGVIVDKRTSKREGCFSHD